jgi:hypothetical protein
MKSLKNYIAETTKMYIYYIKVAMHLDDDQVNAIKSLLSIYQLVDFGTLTRIEDDKYDFFDIPDKNVHCIRIVTNMPISSYILEQLIRDALNVSEKLVVVRGVNEPVELEAELQKFKQDVAKEVKDSGFTFASRLDTDRIYNPVEEPDVTNIFGDEYNTNLLAHLANIKADRKSTEFEPHAGLFSWVEMKKVKPGEPVQDTSDFNAQFKTPKPITGKNNKVAVDDKVLGANGNFDDGAAKNIAFYTDKQNKKNSIGVRGTEVRSKR